MPVPTSGGRTSLLTEKQNEERQENYLTPAAPQDYPTPERLVIEATVAPDLEALEKEAAAEIAAWEAENGPLPEMVLHTILPVFALEGYARRTRDNLWKEEMTR